MPKYEVRLESPVDSQARIVSLDAETEAAARETCEQSELDVVNFSLLPPDKDVWEVGGPVKAQFGEDDGVVDLSRWDARHQTFAESLEGKPYKEHVRAAEQRLEMLASRIEIGSNGKVRGHSLTPVAKARYLAHVQSEPYTVAEIREITRGEADRRQLVRLAQQLHGDDPSGWERALEEMRDQGIPLGAVTAQVHGVAVTTTDDGSSPIVWGTGTGGNAINCALLTGYTANVDTHQYWSSAVASEITGTGYTANGVALAGKSSLYDTASDQTRLDANDVSWTTSTLSATDAAIVNRTPATDATRPIYGSIDFGATVSTTAGTFQITFDATGIIVRDYT